MIQPSKISALAALIASILTQTAIAAPACNLDISRQQTLTKTFSGSSTQFGGEIIALGGEVDCNLVSDSALDKAVANAAAEGYGNCQEVSVTGGEEGKGLGIPVLLNIDECSATAYFSCTKQVAADADTVSKQKCEAIQDCYTTYVESGTASDQDFARLNYLAELDNCSNASSQALNPNPVASQAGAAPGNAANVVQYSQGRHSQQAALTADQLNAQELSSSNH